MRSQALLFNEAEKGTALPVSAIPILGAEGKAHPVRIDAAARRAFGAVESTQSTKAEVQGKADTRVAPNPPDAASQPVRAKDFAKTPAAKGLGFSKAETKRRALAPAARSVLGCREVNRAPDGQFSRQHGIRHLPARFLRFGEGFAAKKAGDPSPARVPDRKSTPA
jgi:hypothetical protein